MFDRRGFARQVFGGQERHEAVHGHHHGHRGGPFGPGGFPGFPGGPGWGFGGGFPPFGGGRGGRRGPKQRRGSTREAVLRLLTERPMHGYELIQEISARSENVWRPSPGSIYPTLQLLADEGLISAGVETGGRKLFSLTETGVAEAAKLTGPAPWEQLAEDAESDDGDLRRTIGGLTAAAMQIAWAADTAQRAEAIKVLDEARRKLYLIMAEAGVPDPESGADAES